MFTIILSVIGYFVGNAFFEEVWFLGVAGGFIIGLFIDILISVNSPRRSYRGGGGGFDFFDAIDFSD